MRDYEPLDLAAFCNLVDDLPGAGAIDADERLLLGLPFRFGGAVGGEPALVGFGAGLHTEEQSIPVATTAHRVVFAHRLLQSRILDGADPGERCADYVFRLADGEEHVVAIRERFEIGAVPMPWGQPAFRARGDAGERLVDRHGGPWGLAGRRLAEVQPPDPIRVYLWAWVNPRPDVPLQTIVIRPAGPRFAIAGITLGHLDEPVFTRGARRPVKIELLEPADAQRPFALEVAVDRGAATFAQPLRVDDETPLGVPAWGDTENPGSSPAYVELSATPSATVTVAHDGETLGSFRFGDLEAQGELEPTSRLRVRIAETGRNWIKTVVMDADTGAPIPCRIHFRSPDGIPYQPHGHHAHVNANLDSWNVDIGGDVKLGQTTFAYINGRCEGWLPRGDVIVEAAKGYEYEPLRDRVTIEPGQQELRLRLRRAIDLRAERYVSGDTHVHFLSTQGAHLEAAGEGLTVVNLLLAQWGHLFSNVEDFTGAPSVGADTIVHASQENRQHVLGHLTLLGITEPVMPWSSGGPGEAEIAGNLETTLSRWADRAHEQGGTVILTHLPNPNGEPAALVATGRADAVEWLIQMPYIHAEYYRYLNLGYRLPLVGGTDKMTADVPVGLYRTYVHIPEDEPITYDSWCRALRGGNTFVSGGPLVRLAVEGAPMGATVTLPAHGGTVEVHAHADSVIPFGSLEIIVNGSVVARIEAPGGSALRLDLHERIPIRGHSWIAARCGGPAYFDGAMHLDGWRRRVMAHTSPVYVAAGEGWTMFDPDSATYMLTVLDGSLSYIREQALQWPAGTVTHHHGYADHQAFLEEPFQQAIAAIHRRMHEHGLAH
jgi:hypothetical protein